MKLDVTDPKALLSACKEEQEKSWELVKKANSFPDNISPLLRNVYTMGYLNGCKFITYTLIQAMPKDSAPAADVQPEPNDP